MFKVCLVNLHIERFADKTLVAAADGSDGRR
jgi:hypothetical protein